jgi:hypothetical protein
MSTATPAEAFADRAPLLDPPTVAKVVLFDLFAPEVREHAERVYVYGSFVDDSTELDREGGTSDLDVYVTVADGLLPGDTTEVSTRFGATTHGLLCRAATQGWLNVYGRPEPVVVSLPVDDSALRESLLRAERAAWHARGIDPELLQFRATDLTLGTTAAFERFLGDDPRLEVWPLND